MPSGVKVRYRIDHKIKYHLFLIGDRVNNIKIAVIGCGPAGKSCAIDLAKKGFYVDIYEKDKIGGTCLNYGCTYITGLREMADIINNLNLIKNNNDKNNHNKIVLEDIISFKDLQKRISLVQNKIREKLKEDIKAYPNIKLHFKEYSTEDFEDYDYIVYATGKNYTSEYNGIRCLNHKDIVNLMELPEKILIIGGGTVAAEYASIFSNFGSEVVVYVRSKFLKMIVDKDIRNYINKFIKFKITKDKEEFGNLLKNDNYTKILATGGRPKFEVDDYMRVIKKNEENNRKVEKNIFSCGDSSIGRGGNTPIARMEGRIVAQNIFRSEKNMPLIKPNYEFIPNSIRMDLNISYVRRQTDNSITFPNTVGRGTFFRVSNHIGMNKLYYENNKIVGAISMTPSIEIIPYFAQYLKGVDIYRDFVEIHPSTDPFYGVIR